MGLVLRGGTVLVSLDPPRAAPGDVWVEGDRIVDAPSGPPDGTPSLDCSGCLVVPGNVCAHHHLYSALARGMPYRLAPPGDFLQILQRVWWRLDRALDEESIRASAAVAGLEALLSGTTTVIDHHASPNAIDGSLDVIADELSLIGLRSILCYEVTDRDGPGRARAGLEENRRFARRVAAGARPLARAMVGAHASFTLSDATLEACAAAAAEAGVGVHVHLAEDGTDQADCVARTGVGVVERLGRAGILGSKGLAAHCVRLDAGGVDRVNASGALVAHNCRSNMNNSVGRASVGAFGRLGLGTDGIDGDMFAESRAAFWRRREEDGGAAPEWSLARLAEGARFTGEAFGEPLLGRLEPAAPADLTVLDYEAPAPLEEAGAPGHWMFGLSARRVRDVVVAGRIVVRDGRSTLVDQDKVAAGAREVAASLWDRMDAIPAHPFEPGSLP